VSGCAITQSISHCGMPTGRGHSIEGKRYGKPHQRQAGDPSGADARLRPPDACTTGGLRPSKLLSYKQIPWSNQSHDQITLGQRRIRLSCCADHPPIARVWRRAPRQGATRSPATSARRPSSPLAGAEKETCGAAPSDVAFWNQRGGFEIPRTSRKQSSTSNA
jgi:hypothetical protein